MYSEQHHDYLPSSEIIRTESCVNCSRADSNHRSWNCDRLDIAIVDRYRNNRVPRSNENSTRIAIRLQLLEAERAIQQREWEATKRAIEQERKAMLQKYKLLEERLANRRKATKSKQLDLTATTTVDALYSEAEINNSSADNVPEQDETVELENQHFAIQPIATESSVDLLHMKEIQQRKCRAFLNISSNVPKLHFDGNVESSNESCVPLALPAILQSDIPSARTKHQFTTRSNCFGNQNPIKLFHTMEETILVFAAEPAIRIKVIFTVPCFRVHEANTNYLVNRIKIDHYIGSSAASAFVKAIAPEPDPPPTLFNTCQLATRNVSAAARNREKIGMSNY
ncbi:uncharacterized protein LOC134202286 [Armigeres subalbatus]|uniref:uncharacterized protein LOC134202286 n=1 Tax=Armigeres subalbatus TaxID=124917 RepID=UPI002ED3C967